MNYEYNFYSDGKRGVACSQCQKITNEKSPLAVFSNVEDFSLSVRRGLPLIYRGRISDTPSISLIHLT